MSWDGTIHLGDIIMAVIALGLVPLVRLLVSTLWTLRDNMRDLTAIVVGHDKDPSGGLVEAVAGLKKETLRHRNWLIEIQASHGAKLDDRS